MSLHQLADNMRTRGRNGDTQLVHMTTGEVAGLQQLAKAAGGTLTRNPDTGLPEASFLKNLLPSILGAASMFIPGMQPLGAAMIGGAAGAITNKDNPLMGALSGAMGGYGGAGLMGGLQGMGAGSAAANAAAIQNPALAGAVGQGAGSQSAMLAAQNAGFGQEGLAQLAQAAGGQAPSAAQTLGYGAQAAVRDPQAYMAALGGPMEALKMAGMAASPVLSATPEAGDGMPKDDAKGSKYEYEAGYTGGEQLPNTSASAEQRWFNPRYKKLAEGGSTSPSGTSSAGMSGMSKAAFDYLMGAPSSAAALPAAPAAGGTGIGTPSSSGSFTFNPGTGTFTRNTPAAGATGNAQLDRMAGMLGLDDYGGGHGMDLGSTGGVDGFGDAAAAGIGGGGWADGGVVSLAKGGFVIPADVVSMLGNGSSDAGLELLAQRIGAQPIDGPGDGMSDSIETSIDGQQPAAVARQEAYLAPEQVQRLGGAKKLYAMMDRIREQAHGKRTQQRQINPDKALA